MSNSSDQFSKLMSMMQALMIHQVTMEARNQEIIVTLSKRLDDLIVAMPARNREIIATPSNRLDDLIVAMPASILNLSPASSGSKANRLGFLLENEKRRERKELLISLPTHEQADSSQASPPPLLPPDSMSALPPKVNLVTRNTELEFPTYDGRGDPLWWLTRCEQLFRYQQIPVAEWISLASFHMLDIAQLWFGCLQADNPGLIWSDFKRACNMRFGSPICNNPLGALTRLRQTGPIDDYLEQFQILLAHVTIPPEMQVGIFTAGLRDRLRLDVEFKAPRDLVTAMSLARLCDYQILLAQEAYVPTITWTSEGRAEGTQTPHIRHVSPSEMFRRRLLQLCVNCDERFTSGHRCKRLFYLHAEENLKDSDDE